MAETGPIVAAPTNLWLDPTDVIASVDEAWLEFARANEAPELTREAVVGLPLSTFIAGLETAKLTALLAAAARRRRTAIAVPFRCDSPRERRFMTMTLRAEPDGGVHFEYRLDRSEPRAPVPLFDLQAPRLEEFVYVCSWCRRVRLGDAWKEVAEVIAEGDLFGRGEAMPKISHGVCSDCAAALKRSMRGGSPAA